MKSARWTNKGMREAMKTTDDSTHPKSLRASPRPPQSSDTTSSLTEVMRPLEEIERWASCNRLASLFPDEGPLRRALYPSRADADNVHAAQRADRDQIG